MIQVRKSIPLSRLALLEAEDLVIRRDGDALIAYFDFENPILLNRHQLSESFDRLQEGLRENQLSFHGLVGFFGYEFLAANFDLRLTAKTDLDLPDGWFARPNSLVR